MKLKILEFEKVITLLEVQMKELKKEKKNGVKFAHKIKECEDSIKVIEKRLKNQKSQESEMMK